VKRLKGDLPDGPGFTDILGMKPLEVSGTGVTGWMPAFAIS